MAQTLLPDGNSSTTNWIEAAGDGDGDWFDELDEGVAGNDGDTTSWRSPLSPVNEAIAVTLQNATDPAASTGHIIRAVWRKNSTAGRTLSGKLELLQGANVIAASTDSDVAENTFQTFTYTLSGTEADSITDYTDLILRVTANDESGAGAGRLLILTALEMEVPDAAAGATLTQDGYRFYDDDGGEGAATPLAGEDTDAEIEPETNVRLRVQLDADGDADAAQYRLDFRRMALTTLEDDFGDGSMDTGLWTKAAYLVGTNQDVTVVESGGVVTITPVADTAGSNYNGYKSVDTFDFTGMAASCAITEVAQDINEIAVFVDSANSIGYDIEGGVLYSFIRLDDDPSDQTNITYSATTHKYLRIRHDAGTDEIVWETSPDNADWTERRRADRPFAITNMGLNIFGGTYGSRSSPGQMVFDDAWLGTIDGDWTAVAASATDVLLAASANITASGENTTAQLTAPAGKTTGDFEAGRIQDDENPADSIDLTADAYTELEWCVEFAAGVDAGTDYQFRLSIGGTALDSYAVTPTLTVAASGATFTLTAENGSYTLAGQTSALLAGRLLVAAAGSFSQTGQDAGALAGRLLTALNGSYALTGQDAGLLAGRLLAAEAGSYTVTGQDVALLASRLLAAEAGAYVLTGRAATLLAARLLLAASGGYTLTGQDVTLVYSGEGEPDYTLIAEAGSFSLTGQAAAILAARLLTAEAGAFAVSGQDTALLISRLLTAEAGSFSLGGQDTALLVNRSITAESGSYALTGREAVLLASRLLLAASGSFSLTGRDATLTYSGEGEPDFTLLAESGSYALTGQDAGLLHGRVLVAEGGSYALTGQDTALLVARLLTAGSGAYTLTGQDAALLRGFLLTAEPGSYTLAGQEAAFVLSRRLLAEAGSFTLTGQPVTLVYSAIETPAERVYLIEAEGRIYAIALEGAYIVPAENRVLEA